MLTAIMRGEFPDEDGDMPRLADRFRAAELLARHYGLLQPPEKAGPDAGARRRMAEEIEAEMAALLGAEEEEKA
ncbi:MAG: hypothetical protein IJK28_05440 [Clostridia bacterium]|nr:hypothetical protein [Clostridia bacterium]